MFNFVIGFVTLMLAVRFGLNAIEDAVDTEELKTTMPPEMCPTKVSADSDNASEVFFAILFRPNSSLPENKGKFRLKIFCVDKKPA